MRTKFTNNKDYIWCDRRMQQRAVVVCLSTCSEHKRNRCKPFREYIGRPVRSRRTKREIGKGDQNEN